MKERGSVILLLRHNNLFEDFKHPALVVTAQFSHWGWIPKTKQVMGC